MLKLKLQYFGHLMQRVDSLEKTLMLGAAVVALSVKYSPKQATVFIISSYTPSKYSI